MLMSLLRSCLGKLRPNELKNIKNPYSMCMWAVGKRIGDGMIVVLHFVYFFLLIFEQILNVNRVLILSFQHNATHKIKSSMMHIFLIYLISLLIS